MEFPFVEAVKVGDISQRLLQLPEDAAAFVNTQQEPRKTQQDRVSNTQFWTSILAENL